jgi:two-component system, OmpR family, sensor histidine kinase KdpD
VKQKLPGEKKADSFLRLIRRVQRGRLKIYLGYGAGVGKTYQMLQEGQRLKAEGIDVVVGLVETHGRSETAILTEGLEVIPRRKKEYRGVTLEEMDLDTVLERKPQVALIDELAHTNAPGSRNPKRYQDVEDILSAGIHVVTTLNIQHLESLYDTVEKTVHVKVRERLPDSMVAEADEIVNVDLTPEDLRKRLQEGKIYPSDRIETALSHFFAEDNLETLRELTLRELAAQIDMRRREHTEEEETAAPDQVMVCLSSGGPNSEMLLRYASRVAGRLNRNWYAVYVQTPHEAPTVIDSQTQRVLSGSLTLAKQLGAMVFTYKGEDVAETLLRFAKEYRVGHVVIGSPGPMPLWKRLLGRKSIVQQLIDKARGLTLVILDTHAYDSPATAKDAQPTNDVSSKAPAVGHALHPALSSLVAANRILIWDQPVAKELVLRGLVDVAVSSRLGDPNMVLIRLLQREQESSTFFNEGVAFPHARLDSVERPVMALGITKQGVSDVSLECPVILVFLILSPAADPDAQIRVLSLAARAAKSRHLLQNLMLAANGNEALEAIRQWEMLDEPSGQKQDMGGDARG